MNVRGAEHESVLLEEAVAAMLLQPDGVYVDATCGLGGHAEKILDVSAPGGRLLGVDRDPLALALAGEKLSRFGSRAKLVQGDFSNLVALAAPTHHPVDAVLADLGVSSIQFDNPVRGFSFQTEGELDMRMGPDVDRTARELIESLDADALAGILRDFGEVRRAGTVARAIVRARDAGELESTLDLARVVARVSGGRKGRIHPATLVFQALRIAVNRELDELGALLAALPDLLRAGGRAAIISFHSLEDRMVKRFFSGPPRPSLPRRFPIELEAPVGPMRPLTKKPIRPSAEEIARNPRARSACLRIAERREEVFQS